MYMHYDDIVNKINEASGLSKVDIEDKVKTKMNQLSGLVSKEGAATIIANELGVKLFQSPLKLKIKNIVEGMRNATVVGRVRQVFEKRSFTKGERSGTVANFILSDETSSVRVVLWGEKADIIEKLAEGMPVKISNALVRNNNGRKELHLNEKAEITLNPLGEDIPDLGAVRKSIKELSENDINVEILGTIVQIFNPNFFEICSVCGKRVKQKEDGFACDAHGAVQQSYSYVLNMFVDDGTDSVRAVFFRHQVESLLNKSYDEMILYKENPDFFNEMKSALLGSFVKIQGKVFNNSMFNRIEITANKVVLNPNPEEELQRLKNEEKKELNSASIIEEDV